MREAGGLRKMRLPESRDEDGKSDGCEWMDPTEQVDPLVGYGRCGSFEIVRISKGFLMNEC